MDEPEPKTSPISARDGQRTEEFVRQLAASEWELYAFIMMLLPRWADADEVRQRTTIVLWRKYDQFAPGTDFVAWACQVAKFEIKSFLRTQLRDRLYFEDTLIDSLSDTRATLKTRLSDRQDALVHCLEKLDPRDREIIDRCYSNLEVTAKDVALTLGRPVNTVYKALIRIRRSLLECIERRLSAGGRS
jgi:RNA polymerase sigma-70 factor, ECF subfamily